MSDERSDTRPAARRLGRGLGALLGDMRREEPLVSTADEGGAGSGPNRIRSDGELASLPIASIEPHPDQPRRHFDEDALAELAASIAARGVIQPVVVRPLPSGRFQLVAG